MSSSCHPYNETYYTSETKPAYIAERLVSPIVEFGDDGYLRDPAQLENVLTAMDTAAADTKNHPGHPVVALVFIHGWHNNARVGNDNLRDFNQFAFALQQRLQKDSPEPKPTVLPIYLAWRGQNTWEPAWYNTWVIPWVAQYATFFSRKATSERIGRGGLEVALARISRKWHEWQSRPGSIQCQNYLVIAGHSFGGAALLTATLPQLVAEQENVRAAVIANQKALSAGADNMSPVRPAGKAMGCNSAEDLSMAPANLLVAINPAIEASMLDRTVLGSRSKITSDSTFDNDGKATQLLVLDADNDNPRGVWFPLGQRVANAFHISTDHDDAEREAAGKLKGQAQFSLTRNDSVPLWARSCDAVPTSKGTLHLFSLDGRPCRNTVMVVQTHEKIINNHNGIWGDENREFLIHFFGQQRATFLSALR